MAVRGVAYRMGLAAASLALGGCVATGDIRPGIVRHETPKQIRSRFHGPDVSVRARTISTRRGNVVRPQVSVGDSTYVVVGTVGWDGTLRIVYPARPGDPHLIEKKGQFDAPTFDAFIPGNLFVIASSMPLKLEQLAENGKWSIFEVVYDVDFGDPSTAVTDLAASIGNNGGDLSIAYSAYGRLPSTTMGLGSSMRRSTPPPR